ncbi:MAG: hypothetical protein GX334_03585 [Firmicutes bacterium]|nr:hypothetical protein [Bacillota bacterium]
MMKLSLMRWLLQGVPECLAIATFSWMLLGRQFNARKILSIGLLQALAAYFVRLLPVSFGIHTLILVFSLAALLVYFSSGSYSRVLSVSLVTFVVLGLLELVIFALSSSLFNLTAEAILADPLLSVLMGLPGVALLFLGAFLLAGLKRKIKGIFKVT